MPEIKMN